MKKILLCLVSVFVLIGVIACKNETKLLKLQFDTNGGSEVEAIEAEANARIDKPADPTKEGFTFGGWYSDIDLVEEFEFPERMPSKSMTIYAGWKVTLTFDSQGGSKVNPIVGDPGSVYVMPANPTRDGYVFVGWYLDKAYTTKLTYVMPRENATAYARWQVFEEGSAIDLSGEWLVNDAGSYIVSEEAEGYRITATPSKGEWSYVFKVIDGNAKENTTVVAVVKGTKGVTAVLKLEGGNAEAAIETSVEFTGSDQRIEWTVEPKNLTSIGGQKFLIFLNGGTAGCSDTPEFVIVKSLKLYRTIEADEPQRALLSFMTNGGNEIEPYYLEPGSNIDAPQDPTKEGFVFTGWYSDKELTTKYVFDKMPSTTTIVYAGWKLANEFLDDCDLLGGTLIALDADQYEIENNEDYYSFKKTSSAGEWTFLVLPMTGKHLAGYNILRLNITGKKGEQLLIKINDDNTQETTITFTGRQQLLEIPFSKDLDPNKSLVFCLTPGVAGESGEVLIEALLYGNYPSYINILEGEFKALDEGVYNISQEDAALTISKNSSENDIAYSCILTKLEGVNYTNFDTLLIRLQGPAGEKLLVKINDNNAAEHMIECDGTEQKFEFEIGFDLDPNKAAVVLFANPGENGTGHSFVITELSFLLLNPPVPVEEDELIKVDLLGLEMNALDAGHYEFNNTAEEYVFNKTAAASEWTFIVVPMTSLPIEDTNILRMEVKGTAGQQLLVKLNDDGAAEHYITFNGETQLFEFEYNGTLSPSKPLVLCLTPGVAGVSGSVRITKLEYVNYHVLYQVLDHEIKDNSAYEFTLADGKLELAKKTTGTEWECLIMGPDAKVNGLMVEKLVAQVKGPAGEKLTLKLNDSYENSIVCTGEVQNVVLDINGLLDGSKNFFVFFANLAEMGTGNKFEITKLELVLKDLFDEGEEAEYIDVDLMNGSLSALDAGHYEITTTDTSYTFNKTSSAGEWTFLALPMTGKDLTDLFVLRMEIKGKKGDQLLVKINDDNAGENYITLNGEKQLFEFEYSGVLNTAKSLILCLTPGVAGESEAVVITKLEYSNYHTILDLMDSEFAENNEYVVESQPNQITMKKLTTGSEWNALLIPDTGVYGGITFVKLVVELQGTLNEKIMFKINDNNTMEFTHQCNGSVESLEFEFECVLDPAKALLAIFCNPGENGSGNNFTITKLEMIAQL